MKHPWEYWSDKHGEIKRCDKCGVPFYWDMLTNYLHDDDLCVGRQLLQAKVEIKKFKASTEAYKDAWYKLRNIIGWLWWHHPAIANDATREHYQNSQKGITNVE